MKKFEKKPSGNIKKKKQKHNKSSSRMINKILVKLCNNGYCVECKQEKEKCLCKKNPQKNG